MPAILIQWGSRRLANSLDLAELLIPAIMVLPDADDLLVHPFGHHVGSALDVTLARMA